MSRGVIHFPWHLCDEIQCLRNKAQSTEMWLAVQDKIADLNLKTESTAFVTGQKLFNLLFLWLSHKADNGLSSCCRDPASNT